MSKKCLGCGITLQNSNPKELGYTPDLEKDLCMRCFKLKHYGKNINDNIRIDNEKIINSINEKKSFTAFLCDFEEVSDEVINTYKKIKNKKVLVLTKKDLFPKNIDTNKFIGRLKQYYEIDDDIYFISIKKNIDEFSSILKNKQVIVCGYTSAGKSSLINKLTDSNIVVNKTKKTTLDTITINKNGYKLLDVPGFIMDNYIDNVYLLKPIRQNIKQVLSSQELEFENLIINSNVDNNICFYIPNSIKIIKRKHKSILNNRINIPKNSDLIIKGLGFINIKNSCILTTNIDNELLEVRDSLVGSNHE